MTLKLVFADSDLERLYYEPGFHLLRYGPDLVKAYRRKVTLLGAVCSSLELRQHRALHLEKLQGDLADLYSIRLNKQWRLILNITTDERGEVVIVLEIRDYH